MSLFQRFPQNSDAVSDSPMGLVMNGSISYPVIRDETKLPPSPLVANVYWKMATVVDGAQQVLDIGQVDTANHSTIP